MVIGFAKERFTKNLRSDRRSQQKPYLTTVIDEAAQAEFVARQILKSREAGVPLKDQAVLFRSSHHAAPLELELPAATSRLSNTVASTFGSGGRQGRGECPALVREPEGSRGGVQTPATAAWDRASHRRQGAGQGRSWSARSLMCSTGLTCRKQAAEDWPAFTSLIGRLRKAEKLASRIGAVAHLV